MSAASLFLQKRRMSARGQGQDGPQLLFCAQTMPTAPSLYVQIHTCVQQDRNGCEQIGKNTAQGIKLVEYT